MGASVKPVVDRFRLGFVADPLPGHEKYRDMLCIPYLRRQEDGGWSVVSLRFRCIEDHKCQGHGKYMTISGDRPRLFNTHSLMVANDFVCITEGELDTVTAKACGLESVGVPGATSWQKHFREPFLGYEAVFILSDGDKPGMDFAETVAKTLPNARIIPMPDGEDVNSTVVNNGPKALTERIR